MIRDFAYSASLNISHIKNKVLDLGYGQTVYNTTLAKTVFGEPLGMWCVLNVQGNLVMPGIIEAHSHIGISEEKKGFEGNDCNEQYNPVTPYLQAIDAINPMDPAFHNAIAAGITSVMVGPGSSNVVGGQFAFMKTKGRILEDLIVLAPAAMKVAFGESFAPVSNQPVSPPPCG